MEAESVEVVWLLGFVDCSLVADAKAVVAVQLLLIADVQQQLQLHLADAKRLQLLHLADATKVSYLTF